MRDGINVLILQCIFRLPPNGHKSSRLCGTIRKSGCFWFYFPCRSLERWSLAFQILVFLLILLLQPKLSISGKWEHNSQLQWTECVCACATDNWQELVQKIKSKGMKPGVTLKPGTPIEEVYPLVRYFLSYELILIEIKKNICISEIFCFHVQSLKEKIPWSWFLLWQWNLDLVGKSSCQKRWIRCRNHSSQLFVSESSSPFALHMNIIIY